MLQSANNSSPIILFFSVQITPATMKAYKSKCRLLETAISKNLKVRLTSMSQKIQKMNELVLEDGRFYVLKDVKGVVRKTFININKITKLKLNKDSLNIQYSIV